MANAGLGSIREDVLGPTVPRLLLKADITRLTGNDRIAQYLAKPRRGKHSKAVGFRFNQQLI